MRRCSVFVFVLVLLLACAPSTRSDAPEHHLALDAGRVLVSHHGKTQVFAMPGFTAQDFGLPSTSGAVAFHAGAPWVALPKLGVVLRLLGVPERLNFEDTVVALSDNAIFLRNGTVYGYDKNRIGVLPATPVRVLDLGGVSFVLAGGQIFAITSNTNTTATLRSVGRVPANLARGYLTQNGTELEVRSEPSAGIDNERYQISGNILSKLEGERVVLRVVLWDAALQDSALPEAATHIAVNNDFVVVLSQTRLLVFKRGSLARIVEKLLEAHQTPPNRNPRRA